MTPRPALAPVLVNTGFLWLATAVAAVQLWPIYQSGAIVLLVAVTVVIGTVIAIAGAVWRWPSAIVVAVTLAAFLLFGVPLAVPGEAIGGVLPSVEGLRQLLAGTALGWKQLLTITLPVGDYQALLVPAFVLLLGATVASLSAALRARAGDLAALGPVVILLVGIAFGPALVNWPRTTALVLFAVLLAWLVWRRWYRRRSAIARLTSATTDVGAAPAVRAEHRTFDLRTLLSGVAILLVAAVAAVFAVAAVPPAGARQVLRTAVEQPFDPRDYPSPLAGFRGYLEPDTATSTILTVSGLPSGALLRIATLDSYNGIVYSVGSSAVDSASGAFTRVPYRFDQSALDGTPVRLDVTIGDYAGVWVPSVGKLDSIRFTGDRASTLTAGFYYNDVSGTAADLPGLESGDGYTLDAVVPTPPSTAELAAATPGTADVPAPSVLPQELSGVLDGYTADASTPGTKLAAMVAGIKANGHISHGQTDAGEPASRSGHSADRITTLLTDQRMIGDAEQFAVTAALMAHELGFPARVVYGFAPVVPAGGGVTVVTGASVSAWIEVDTAQYGWVSIDPNPAPGPIPAEDPIEPQVVSRPPSIVQPPDDEAPSTDTQSPPESTQQEPTPDAGWIAIVLLVARVAGWVLLALGVLASPFIGISAAKSRRRRRRRRSGTPIDRVSGGWREYRDAVIDHGFDPPSTATRSEVARTTGGPRAAVLAAVADRAVFAPEATDEKEVQHVWTAVDELRAHLDAGLTRRARFAARVSLRSFGRGRRARDRESE